jgi:long-subunit acyl-CoA synthetase (AMP-forming)/GNAT superfamily N-acetyltransferase
MAMLDIACLTSGVVNLMIPANSVPEHISFILNQTKAAIVIAHNEKQLAKIKSVKNELHHLKKIVLLVGSSADDYVISFEEFLSGSKNADESLAEKMLERVKPDSLATIMYTSGTTGEPKGIMFSHMNIVYKRFCRAMALPEIGDSDRFLSFLPLFHTFGRWLEMIGSVFWGAEYAFMENPSVDTMILNMKLIKPSIFISIPKKWLQLYEYVSSRVDIEVDDHQVIKGAVEESTGGNLKFGLSAAGYLPPDVFQFFKSYGIELMSGFGMTEATGGITMTPPGRYKPNSLGKALPGIKIKLGKDGEILIKGAYVMMGYFGSSEEDIFLNDGWFPSGDIMKIDEDGFIEIIDRKKEIYKNIKGETIAPQKIENFFRDFESIKQVFLVGDHKPFNTVLLYPNDQADESPVPGMNELQKQEYFSSVIVTINKFLAPFERILDFRIIDRPFSDEQGELTAKGTYKRRVIEKNFDSIIESMYTKEHTSIFVKKTEVRIPNWFLREKGCLSRDIVADDEGISISKLNLSLKLRAVQEGINIFRIGSYNYKSDSPYIDMQSLLTNPLLWIGNKEAIDFTGKSIIQWYRQQNISEHLKYLSRSDEVIISEEDKISLSKKIAAGEVSLEALNTAYLLIQTDNIKDCKQALSYIEKILSDETNHLYKLALALVSRPNITGLTETRREIFKAAISNVNQQQFSEIFTDFTLVDKELLDEEVIDCIVDKSKGGENLDVIETSIKNLIGLPVDKLAQRISLLESFFHLITVYGWHHPVTYKRIRRFVMRFYVLGKSPEVSVEAVKTLTNLRNGLREWFGENQKFAVDSETGEEYGWKDVITFEEGIDAEDRQRIKNAVIKTSILREAIFLFSGGVSLRLDNVLPGGVWVSNLIAINDKSIYRISVQTKFQGGFDITLHLNKNFPPAVVKEEIKWLILAETNLKGERLLPKFGGYWEEYDLWTEDFVPRDSVAKFLNRELTRKEENYEQRLYFLWTFFVWNAAKAYINFWQLTNREIELANPLPDNITIPTHDYQTGTLLYSVSQRIKSSSITSYFINFYNMFVKNTVEEIPDLRNDFIWNYIFSGVIEAEGEEKGLELLSAFKDELQESNEFEEKEHVLSKLDSFINTVNLSGYVPKALFFSIKRFHRWFRLNKEASLSAQAEMLFDLYETYELFSLEEKYPAVRTQFYLRTAFKDSSEGFKNTLKEIVKKQHESSINKNEIQQLISGLHLQFQLSEREEFFVTRLSFPHLKPTDSAALIKVKSGSGTASNLVVQLLDNDNVSYMIRNPISPKEISRLHQLFFETNLNVHFNPEHQFLVALSERGFIIGGLFFSRVDDQTAHMEKIVVSSRYRRKGISEGLMNELFNRLKGEHLKYLTTGFFRPEYFYRYGFKIEKKYSGLMKDLLNDVDKK